MQAGAQLAYFENSNSPASCAFSMAFFNPR